MPGPTRGHRRAEHERGEGPPTAGGTTLLERPTAHPEPPLTGTGDEGLRTQSRPGSLSPQSSVLSPSSPRRGATTARLPLVLARLLPHLLVLGTVVAVVAGGGFWDPARRTGPAHLESGTAPDFSVPLDLQGAPPRPESPPGSGYFVRPALPVTTFRLQLTLHEIRQGETIADVAARYRLKPATLLWANNMQDPARPLPAGTKLRVPPTDGMLHQVQANDTLEGIAAKYQVDVAAITGYRPNEVEGPGDLVPNQLLLVPGGQMPTRERIELYVVRPGDTLWTIADRFGLNASTIVWANKLTNADLLAVGQTLVVPPVNGVVHRVAPGESLDDLAARYGVKRDDIVAFAANGLGGTGQPVAGQDLVIPGGTPPAPPPPPPPAPAPAPVVVAQAPQAPQPAVPPQAAPPAPPPPAPASSRGATGSFRWPAVGTITQYFGERPYYYGPGGHNGIDIANATWTPLVAADAGVVIFSGWRGGLGNAVGIDHQNGFVTWYGHAVQLAVGPGQWVDRGQIVAYMGSTGNSTGPHIHFIIVRNGVYVDPLAYLPR